jgi:ankyrin repeat protein
LASFFGHNEVVKVLVDAGADINTQNGKPRHSPAMAAAFTNSVDVLKTLIAHGADLTLRSTLGNTALDIALIERKEDAAKVLLKAIGGDLYPEESVALQIAMADNHAMIKALMTTASLMHSHMEYGACNEYMWMDWVLKQGGDLLKQATMVKMLHAAMESHDLPMIKALLHRGCDVDTYLDSGHTCLSVAVGHRDLELTRLLLDAGADPNKPISDLEGGSYTAFDSAIFSLQDGRDTEVVDLLLESGRCRINKGRHPEATAFSYVLDKSEEWAPGVADSLAIRMINSVSNIDEDRDDIGCTLLHVAVHHGRVYFVDLLLGKGVDIEVTGNDGYTVFIQACQYNFKMIPVLLERGANAHAKYKSYAGALHAAAAEGNVDTLDFLIGRGMNIEDQTLKGYTPLACALTWGREEAAMCLLEHGASFGWSVLDGKQTALHFAARNGLEVVVEKLLTMNVDVDALSDQDWSPLHEVCL